MLTALVYWLNKRATTDLDMSFNRQRWTWPVNMFTVHEVKCHCLEVGIFPFDQSILSIAIVTVHLAQLQESSSAGIICFFLHVFIYLLFMVLEIEDRISRVLLPLSQPQFGISKPESSNAYPLLAYLTILQAGTPRHSKVCNVMSTGPLYMQSHKQDPCSSLR